MQPAAGVPPTVTPPVDAKAFLKMKGLAFAACTEAFQPPRFEREDHARTGFPLDGAHRLVACVSCHPRDPALAAKVPAAVRADLARRKRPVRVSLARFTPVANPSDCRGCHKDPHAGQLDRRVAAEGCTACHTTASFRAVKFDHAKDARFALTGTHAQAACGSCHRPDAAGGVRYANLATACSACHADPHAGQFSAGRGKGTDCARCHGVDGWRELKFVHAPPFTAFELAGKHRLVDCQKCHPAVAVAGATVRKYRPLQPRCAGCHEDYHRGAFRAFAPPGAAPGDCAGCHAQGWRPVAFDHARTGFPLEGRHREVTCRTTTCLASRW
ncbi:MAG TPA: hypothetical protein VEB43_10275 [Anaeromyxobacter sp.]|nr:hypothetical protein [Anaeromyxobacter sp.]